MTESLENQNPQQSTKVADDQKQTPQTTVKDSCSSTQMTTFEERANQNSGNVASAEDGLKMDFAAQLASWEDQPLKKKGQTKDETISEGDHSQKMSSDDFNAEMEKLCAKALVSFKQSFQDDILALESACKADPSMSAALELYKAGDKSELKLPAISSLLAVLVTFESEQSLWNTLSTLGMASLECETECQQTRFFEAAMKGAVIAFPSGVVSKISDECDLMPEILMVERLLA